MILFPAIDLREGRAVRLVQGDFQHVTVFNDDPVAQARLFAEQGATHLHVVDLDGALEGVPVHAPLVASIAAAFGGTVHYGGGMRSRAAIETAIATGIDRVVVGTAVVQDGDLLRWAIDRLGDRLVVALDARDGKVATHGWTVTSDQDALSVAADLVRTGVRHLLYTDISRDGMLEGPNLQALRRLAGAAPRALAASASWWRSTPASASTGPAGRSTSTAGARRPGSRPSPGPRRPPHAGPGRSC